MKCINCGTLIEQEDRTHSWIHSADKFRCDGRWYYPDSRKNEIAQPDYFNAYLEEIILYSCDTKSEESLSQRILQQRE